MRRVLILGGARSGKSAHAEQLLSGEPSVTYVATARRDPDDPEWEDRIRAHRARRPHSWRTDETGDLTRVLRTERGPLLVDCLTLWLAGVMDDCGVWAGAPGADVQLACRLDDVVDAWRTTAAHVVAVSNEVGFGVVPPTPTGRRFRDELGSLNARVAADADEAWLVVAGIPCRLR
ncbi:MAG: bifunctional adenosylcobinamide kinase/adenosylcobinamide-phosphate guanylyltransferase [Streptosporangiaceae bacterium]